MMSFVSPVGFMTLLATFMVGAFGSLFLHRHDAWANRWNSFFAVAGSLGGIVFSLLALSSSTHLHFTVGVSPFPLLASTFTIDPLASFFVLTISLIALMCSLYGFGYVQHYYKKYNLGALGFFYQLFIVGMLLVVTSGNALWFLIAWEIMSLASFALVIYDRHDRENIKAGFLYLVMTHLGTGCIVLALLILYRQVGSFDFATMQAGAAALSASAKNLVFFLAIIGFGTKAGVIPFHIWLPSAHPAAPSHVSGLMSGVMIKTGIYMMIRLFLGFLQPAPIWWGITILVLGAISSILGVLYALAEHDLKRLLAYHSIENIGIILLGLGSAMTFSSLQMPELALLSVAASLFHVLNHAIFKSLLFLGAGSVISQVHTRNIEEYGGLIKYMPLTAIFFLIGSAAISGLPPLNGFFSEWLTFHSLFHGMAAGNFSTSWAFIVAAGALAFTSGLALACFVKAFGATFLARPRSDEVKKARESSAWQLVGMGGLAAAAVLVGVYSGRVVGGIMNVGRDLLSMQSPSALVTASVRGMTIGSTASVAAPAYIGLAIVLGLLVWVMTRYGVRRHQQVHQGATWDCGVDLSPRMEITATGFSRSIITIFRGLLKPSVQHDVEYHDEQMRYLPKSRTVTLSINDLYRTYFYRPIANLTNNLSLQAKRVQSGNINAYVLYLCLALVVAMFFVR